MNNEMRRRKDEDEAMQNDLLTYRHRYQLLPKEVKDVVEASETTPRGLAQSMMVKTLIKGYNDGIKALLEALHENCNGNNCEACPLMDLAYELWEYSDSECPADLIPDHFGML